MTKNYDQAQHKENTMTQIPPAAIPSFLRWLEHYHEKMAAEYDKLTRLGNLTPAASDFYLQEMAKSDAILESMKTENH